MTLNEVVGANLVGLLKVDVEGHEFLSGGATLLSDHRIWDIAYKDHAGY